MRCRRPLLLLVLGGLLAMSAGGVARSATQAANPGQAFFHDALIADAKTSSAIRDALKARTAIVDPAAQYSDLTGDGKSDAVVRVHSTGAAGVIAVYVFSTDGGTSKSALRAVFRSQRLYRAVTATSGSDVRIDTPVYEAGDGLCCPSETTRRVYHWSSKVKGFRRSSTRTIKN